MTCEEQSAEDSYLRVDKYTCAITQAQVNHVPGSVLAARTSECCHWSAWSAMNAMIGGRLYLPLAMAATRSQAPRRRNASRACAGAGGFIRWQPLLLCSDAITETTYREHFQRNNVLCVLRTYILADSELMGPHGRNEFSKATVSAGCTQHWQVACSMCAIEGPEWGEKGFIRLQILGTNMHIDVYAHTCHYMLNKMLHIHIAE